MTENPINNEHSGHFYNLQLPQDVMGRLEAVGAKEIMPVTSIIRDYIKLRLMFDSYREASGNKNVTVNGSDVQLDLLYSQPVSEAKVIKSIVFSDAEYDQIKDKKPMKRFILEACLLGLRLQEENGPTDVLKVGIGEKNFMFV